MQRPLSLNKPLIAISIGVMTVALNILGLPGITDVQKVKAISASDFKAGRIIDDKVFYNKDSMNTEQIQSFLDRLIPNCDTWGTGASGYGGTRAQYAASRGWHAPPYSCINKYHENPNNGETSFEKGGGAFAGGVSAAQIIYNAAQKYSINPQVLLVLLKKESAGPLTSDSWPLKSQYKYAMGYGCPDSGPGYSANCDSNKAGFYKQVELAAWQLNYYKEHSNDYRYKIGWNDIQYSTSPSCGTKRVYIENLATLSLYIYTPYTPNEAALANYPGEAPCGAYGNRNFFMFFNEWFGSPSTPAPTECDSNVADIICVWSVRKSDESQFLTTSKSELATTMYSYGWVNEGIAFYASATAKDNTTPVYRLQKNGRHFYTTVASEYNTMKNTQGWGDEGIAFYTPLPTTTNTSHKVYRLLNTSNSKYYWTTDVSQVTYLVSNGYVLQGNLFNSLSGRLSPPATEANRNNIYRLRSSSTFFYTTSLAEADAVIRSGYKYDGVVTTTNTDNTGTPVYRLRYATNKYFYTSNPSERNSAIQTFGMIDEGVGYYVDAGSAQIYRLSNTASNTYFYATDFDEVMRNANVGGWIYQGVLNPSLVDNSPVYRFLNLFNHRHFYTINPDEAAKITNTGWQYETIAFNANKTTGVPVYRLLLRDKHFYTTNETERDLAISKFGYIFEGPAFYVSATPTTKPTYRLQGGNDEYFYTASSQEKDTAVSRYGYYYEGEGFYLP